MTWFVNLELFKKILLVSIVMMGCAFCWGSFNTFLGYLLMVRDSTEKNQALVESMTSILDALNADAKSGKMTEQEAQDLAKQIIRSARYDGDRYFLVTTTKGEVVAYADSLSKEEVALLSGKNAKARNLYLDFSKTATANKEGAEIRYDWPKAGVENKGREFSKNSYVKLMRDWGWVVETGVYLDEIQKITFQSMYLEFGFVAVFAFVLGGGTYGAVRVLSRPLVILSKNMNTLAAGKLDVDVPYEQRGDEVGLIAKAFKVFKENAIEKDILEKEQEEMKLRAEREKQAMMKKLADDFEAQVSGTIRELDSSAQTLRETSITVTEASSTNVEMSRVVSTAAAEADSNVQTVAAATEELSASSAEIARQISSVAEKSSRAAGEAQKTNQAVNELNVMADSIGEVVAAIKGIAEQTNLLALNATIEAARAGEAGKGFAVVADEVKKLAMETAQKTEEIDKRVVNIQDAIRLSTESMHRIISDVQEIDSATASVAGAVEEQNAATAEIGRNISEASQGTQRVSGNIFEVEKNAEHTKDAAHKVEDASDDIAQLTKSLEESVHKFLGSLKR